MALLKADGLEPFADFPELIESEIKGAVSMEEMRDILEEKCKIFYAYGRRFVSAGMDELCARVDMV